MRVFTLAVLGIFCGYPLGMSKLPSLSGRNDYGRMLKVEVQFRFSRFVEGLPITPQLLIQRVTDYATVSFEKMTGILLFFLIFLYEMEEMFV
jgi:hypothetical protein